MIDIQIHLLKLFHDILVRNDVVLINLSFKIIGNVFERTVNRKRKQEYVKMMVKHDVSDSASKH